MNVKNTQAPRIFVYCVVLFSSSITCSCERYGELDLWPPTTSSDHLNKVVYRWSPSHAVLPTSYFVDISSTRPSASKSTIIISYSDSPPMMYISIDRTRQNDLHQAGHTGPTQVNMYARAMSYRSYPSNDVCDSRLVQSLPERTCTKDLEPIDHTRDQTCVKYLDLVDLTRNTTC